ERTSGSRGERAAEVSIPGSLACNRIPGRSDEIKTTVSVNVQEHGVFREDEWILIECLLRRDSEAICAGVSDCSQRCSPERRERHLLRAAPVHRRQRSVTESHYRPVHKRSHAILVLYTGALSNSREQSSR